MRTPRATIILPALVAAALAPRPSDTAIAHPSTNPPTVSTLTKDVVATVETEPVQTSDDAADDSAIWVHPTDPAKSLIIGTNKKAGLGVYDLAGTRVQDLPEGRLNNVDLRQNLRAADGTAIDLIVASDRDDNSLTFFTINNALSGLLKLNAIPTGFNDVYGVALYRSRSGALYVFACDKAGLVRQWRLTIERNSAQSAAPHSAHAQSSDVHHHVRAELAREFHVGGQSEGMVADDELGWFYVGEEDAALWRYPAEPGVDLTEQPRVAIDLVRSDTTTSGRITRDVEGVTIVPRANQGKPGGWIIASSQGDNSYTVYDRLPPHAFLFSFQIIDGQTDGGPIDGTQETDGIDASPLPLGPAFPRGVFVAQDGENVGPAGEVQRQNFKLVPLHSILPD